MPDKRTLKLYVMGQTLNSKMAIKNLRAILQNELKGLYTLKVIDVLKKPNLAIKDKIIATPTLIKVLPQPVRKIIGDLSNKEKVLVGLDFISE
ncbi:MAG: circadian clock protein KaiB [Planctomycetota bacterium]